MRRLLYALLVGFVGAGLVHVAILMRLPSVSAGEVWRRAENTVLPGRATAAEPFLFAPDPFFRRAVCRFDLRQGAGGLRAQGSVAAWFLSVHAPDGSDLASLDDRGAAEGRLDIALLTPAQRAAAGGSLAKSAPVEVEAGEVLALLEVFVPDATWSAATDAFIGSVACDAPAGRHTKSG